jgi:hypothetical protein
MTSSIMYGTKELKLLQQCLNDNYMNLNELNILFTSRDCAPLDLECYKMTEDFYRKNCSDPNLLVFHTYMEDLMERNRKEENVERKCFSRLIHKILER